MEYKFKRVEEFGYVILEEGHTMFPDDVVRRFDRLNYLETKYSENKWADIETAPKDGTEILVCDIKYYCPETASWRNYHPNAQGKPTWRTKIMGHKINPTHWMPLPKQPGAVI